MRLIDRLPSGAPMVDRSRSIQPPAVHSRLHATVLVLALLVTVLAVSEAIPRAFELPRALAERRSVMANLYQLDDAAGYVLRPNYDGRVSTLEYDQTFHTNARGLRGPDLGPKPPGEFRLVVLGDSIVFGAMIPEEQLLTEQLQTLLHARGYAQLRVVNVAVPGWGTFNEAGYLAANASWIQPDLVVLAVFLGNNVEKNVLATAGGYVLTSDAAGVAYGPRAGDVVQNSVERFPHNFDVMAIEHAPGRLDRFVWQPGEPLPEPAGNPPAAELTSTPKGRAPARLDPFALVDIARTWLRDNSRLYLAASDALFSLGRGYSRPETLGLDTWDAYALRDEPDWYWVQVAYPLTERYLEATREAAANAGASLIALLIPHNAQYDEAQRQNELSRFHLSPDEVDLTRPNRELTVAANRHGIPVIDLLPALSARADRDALTYQYDFHLTPLGHTVVAEALADALEQRSLLPPR
ncbi:MAG: SGNH/GDSL hydrolase family protein [Chloroflexi bacterium]|nr:SGNH/GDSL hydrolase family protein [Chloroflexota bacterium]